MAPEGGLIRGPGSQGGRTLATSRVISSFNDRPICPSGQDIPPPSVLFHSSGDRRYSRGRADRGWRTAPQESRPRTSRSPPETGLLGDRSRPRAAKSIRRENVLFGKSAAGEVIESARIRPRADPSEAQVGMPRLDANTSPSGHAANMRFVLSVSPPGNFGVLGGHPLRAGVTKGAARPTTPDYPARFAIDEPGAALSAPLRADPQGADLGGRRLETVLAQAAGIGDATTPRAGRSPTTATTSAGWPTGRWPGPRCATWSASAARSSSGRRSGDRDQFPLLVKFLDAHQVLSVQVHPDDALGRRLADDNGKTEAWVVVHAEPGALIYAGLRPGVTRDDFAAACETGRVRAAPAPLRAGGGRLHPDPGGDGPRDRRGGGPGRDPADVRRHLPDPRLGAARGRRQAPPAPPGRGARVDRLPRPGRSAPSPPSPSRSPEGSASDWRIAPTSPWDGSA